MSSALTAVRPPSLGLRANWAQFSLLVLVNAFVGAMIGMERSILPALAEQEFQLVAHTAILSFIAVFGVVKAAGNYAAGRLSDVVGRRTVLIAGWWMAAPVPFVLMWAPSWGWILFANVLLGASQGLTWSVTVIMKIDLAGPRNRGLAMGINEFAGYVAVALSALATGWIAASSGLRPYPFLLGVVFVAAGLVLSIFSVRETRHLPALEPARPGPQPSFFAVNQAGLVNNLNDGVAWGLFPLVFAGAGLALGDIAVLVAVLPAVWGVGQLFTGALSDRFGRKGFIVAGMWTQAAGLAVVATSADFWGFFTGSATIGAGTAMVYPTLLAAIGDAADPARRASVVGAYRLWRDLGYAAGALVAGVLADWTGLRPAVFFTAALTLVSGTIVAFRLHGRRVDLYSAWR